MANQRRSETFRIDLTPSGHLQGQWSYTEPGPDFAVVYVHGFRSVRYGEKAQALEESCARRGWAFATFDFRGHGESSGSVHELRGSGLLSDLSAVSDWLKSKGIKRLCLVGSSMGAWASSWFAVQNPGAVVACAFIAPGFHFLTARWERLSESEREAWEKTGILRIEDRWIKAELGYCLVEEADQFPPNTLLRTYRTPTVIFQGMQDDVVPYQRTIEFVEHAAATHIDLRLYKDGDHRLVDRKDEMAEAACGFFEKCFN